MGRCADAFLRAAVFIPDLKQLVLAAEFALLCWMEKPPDGASVLAWYLPKMLVVLLGCCCAGFLRFAAMYKLDDSDEALVDLGLPEKLSRLQGRVQRKWEKISHSAGELWADLPPSQRAAALSAARDAALRLAPHVSAPHFRKLCPDLWAADRFAEPGGLTAFVTNLLPLTVESEALSATGDAQAKDVVVTLGSARLTIGELAELPDEGKAFVGGIVGSVRLALLLRCADGLIDAAVTFHNEQAKNGTPEEQKKKRVAEQAAKRAMERKEREKRVAQQTAGKLAEKKAKKRRSRGPEAAAEWLSKAKDAIAANRDDGGVGVCGDELD